MENESDEFVIRQLFSGNRKSVVKAMREILADAEKNSEAGYHTSFSRNVTQSWSTNHLAGEGVRTFTCRFRISYSCWPERMRDRLSNSWTVYGAVNGKEVYHELGRVMDYFSLQNTARLLTAIVNAYTESMYRLN